MDEGDREAFAELVTEALGFYRQDVTEFQLEIWWEALRRFELAEVRKAFSFHIQNPDRGQFPPRPADVTRYLAGGSTDRALRAWSSVERAIKHIGPYRSIVFDDPIIHRVIDDMGGWLALCETSTERDLEFKGQEFRTRYQGYAVRRPQDWPPQLPGYAEQDARARSLQPPDPVVYGDHQRALAVHEQGQERKQGPVSLAQVQAQMGRLEQKEAGPGGEPEPAGRRRETETGDSSPGVGGS